VPVSSSWDNPQKTVYRITFTGAWSQDDMHEIDRAHQQALAEVSYRVITLVDLRQSRIAPSTNLFEAGVPVFRDPRVRESLIVVMTASRLMRQTGTLMMGILRTLFPERSPEIAWASGEPEAYRIIERYWRDNGLHGRV
jgi:hypothetical protein